MDTGPGRSCAAPGPDAFRDPAGNSGGRRGRRRDV